MMSKSYLSQSNGKDTVMATNADQVVSSSPPPLSAPIAQHFSVSVAGEEGLLSCVLPEELLVEIFAERLQLNDCHRGVVFDGLETLFSQNIYSTANSILKALNNRRFIYFVTIKLEYAVLKEQEKKAQEEKTFATRKAEDEKRFCLEDMSEDEYDALTDEDKAEVDKKRLGVKKERIRKELEERREKERREREAFEEQKKLEEESSRLQKKKGKKQIQIQQLKEEMKDGKKSVAGGKGSTERILKSQAGARPHDSEHPIKVGSSERPESQKTESSDKDKAKRGSKDVKKGELDKILKEKGDKPRDGDQAAEEPVKDPVSESEILIVQRFRTFEHAQKDLADMLEFWDRTTVSIRRPVTPSEKSEDDQPHPTSGKKGRNKDKHDKAEKEKQKQLEKENAEKAAIEAAQAQQESDNQEGETTVDGVTDDGIGIPHIVVEYVDKTSSFSDIIESGRLPAMEEVLDGLGLGPQGPPIPPPATLAVVPYPVKRRAPPVSEIAGQYTFVASCPNDPNIGTGDNKDLEQDEEKSAPTEKGKDEHTTPTKSKGKQKSSGCDGKERKKNEEKRQTSKTARRNSSQLPSPPLGANTPGSDADAQSNTGDGLAIIDSKNKKLSIFRWIVPSNGEVVLHLCFQSEELGQFDQTLNMEVVGTRRRYQLFCRGVCAFPSISREPRIVFQHRKKNRKLDEIISKKYILTSEIFEFGPLLVGKSREKYKEVQYPENMEKFTIQNTSPLEADVNFCFLNDSMSETFMLDPPSAILKSGESASLTVWAYPKVPGHYEDAVVCCIRENPEPVVFKISCDGFRPELELDKKQLHFDRVLLHRKDTKVIYLRNSTQLPVRWKLSGLENLGDDFTVAADSGIVDPKSEYALNAYFRAMKPVQTSKKMIRLEIMDAENIMGVVQTETIQVIAEAYDVALDMSFPKGADGGLDFATVRVMEETKQTCTLKNKGKYEIKYKFFFENVDSSSAEVTNLFTIFPSSGTLNSLDRPTQVQIIFRAQQEVSIKEHPILKCQVIEPNIGEDGEIIAIIPVKVSVKAVFSKYIVLPVSDINFGCLLMNSKKTRTFTIENKGEFDFRYTISKIVKDTGLQATQPRQGRPPVKSDKQSKSRDGSSSGRSVVKPRKADSIRDAGGSQSRLQLGMFTIFPAFGIILPNGHQTITVDCVAEQQGRFNEDLAIDITDRDPTDCPRGIPYKLLVEACIPSINIDDIGSIFEEHKIIKNLSIWQHSNELKSENGGVFCEDENFFYFNNVIVGHKAQARFKIVNTCKVPCDVVFTLKPIVSRGSSKQQQDIFEVEPPRVQIPNHSYAYVVATFTPPSMQSFGATFEASIEGISQTQSKGRQLIFELAGDGNLPRINVAKPLVRNKRGQSLLLFKKNLVGQSESLPLVLHNEGTLPSKVDIDLIDPDHVFSLCPTDDTNVAMHLAVPDIRKLPHTASVIVAVGKKATFDVIYTAHSVQRSQANIRLSVIDNQYEDSIIQLVGEGYEDTITLDNIRSVDVTFDPVNEGNMADDDIQAAKPNLICFGDCYIDEPRTLTFSMTNHSKEDCIRFQWPDLAWLKFSPHVGHLHPCSSKDFTVTFKADQPRLNTARSDLSKEKSDKLEQAKADQAKPVPCDEQQVLCEVNRIVFDKPIGQIADWDDRLRIVKWENVPSSPQSATESVKPAAKATPRPAKKKVVETEPEPVYTEVSESSRNIELLVTGTADFCRYKCKTESINFKDTLMFQTRIFQFTLGNKGSIKMDYNWQIVMENFSPTINRTVTFISEAERPESHVDVIDTQYVPFTIEPEFGTIEAGKKVIFKVKFSPLDVNDYGGHIICTIPNLAKNQQDLVVSLKGRSLMPYCHFELTDSDYLTCSLRNPELRGPGGMPPGSTLDSNTRVLEFCCIGIDMKMTKSFSVVNPTSQQYSFQWICEDEIDPKVVPSFRCLHQKGLIKSGKNVNVAFEFLATQLNIVESFWTFFIPEQHIKVPFLLVGEAKEPNISLDRSHMNFKALLIGHEAMETIYLLNNEDQPFFFSFLEDSCYSAGYSNHLVLNPMFSTIPPQSRFPISVYFIPNSDKEVNFNLVCKIKRKIQPLTLNVKAEGYSMNCTVLCEDSQGNRVELSDSGLNQINFGEVEVNEKQIRNIFIMNSGKFNFDYKWELNSVYKRKDLITVTPMEGGIMFGEKCKCLMTFCPPCRATLRDCEFVLKVCHGPSYHIALTGLGVTPGLHFSFHSYNFSNCFIYRAGMPSQSVVLKLTNKDKKEISVDCLYRQTSQLYHNFEACVIPSNGSVNITFSFYPREAIRYHETVTFEINGLSRQKIDLYGQGSEMKIEVQDPKHKIVNLGSKVIGQKVRKLIPIVNSSPAPISFTICLTPMLPALQQTNVLTVSPASIITLEPRGGICKVEVMFTPKSRIPQFTEEVVLEISGLFQPLFVVKGACLGMEVSLDTNAIPFGAVVQRSHSLRKIVLCNTGDMSTRFRWDIKKFAPDFSIHPVEGSIAQGMEVTFDVTFHPKELNQDIRYENLRCFLLDGEHKPVTLTLTGMCTQVLPVKEIQHFSTYVRQKDTKYIQIANRTNQVWYLKPIIDGEYWSGPVTIMVEAQHTKPYELTYTPLVMTSENKKHTGSLFFPVPDGTGLLYNLTGTADLPKPNSKTQRDVPCKTNYTEVMPVYNWLKKAQRFRVKFEPFKPEKLEASTTVKGMEYIDVPASGKKDYKLLFFAHKEGVTILKVTFINEQSGEYQYYELTFRATKPGIISTIELSCPVRQSVPYTLRLDNPLPYATTYSGSCSVPEILMPSQMNVVVPAESKGSFALEYQPLRVGETTGRLECNCTDLGQFIYELHLKATQAGLEKALYFHVCLGQNQIQITKFTSFAKQKTDYSCKVDNPDFHVEKSVTAAPGPAEVVLDVTFEPSRLGEQRGRLTVSSHLSGEYIFPLLGTSMPPKPQGPFIVKAGSTNSITFHNVFSTTTAFTFQVDNPLFHITKQNENIRPRKDHRIVVGFDGNDSGSKAAVMGKMIVSCPRSAGGNASAQWVYYLKGVTP